MYRGPLPPADDELSRLAAELRDYVIQLADKIGERNLLRCPRQLDTAADYIEAVLAEAGYCVQRQAYRVSGTPCWNLEAEITGTDRKGEIVIVGVHYDTVPGSPGANDNASAVAALLCLARRFTNFESQHTLRFVAFVNEEAPFAHTKQMGSRVYARRCRQREENVTAMLCLETIGYYDDAPGSQRYPRPLGLVYPSTGNFIAFVGNTRYGKLVRQVVRTFRKSESFPCLGGALPETVSDISRSDHWPFWREGYPALMVTDTAPFRYPHYHTAEDTVDKVDFERTARVVRGLESVLVDLVGSACQPRSTCPE
jgi:Zn-dependent M28 family amino/carboxypeptidase